jgi:PERQ amino acid-rich with GYF domain-containing protein
MPPHMSSNTMSSALRNGEARYSKEQLLDMYRAQRESGSLGKNVEDCFVADWDPHMVTLPVNGAWGKRDDHKTSAGPEVCWDHGGQAEPLGLTDMSDGEKEVGYSHISMSCAFVLNLCSCSPPRSIRL